MTSATHLVQAALIAVLADRFVLDRCLGSVLLPGRSALAKVAVKSGAVALLLTITACLSVLIAGGALLPAGAGYLQPLLYAGLLIFLSMTGELASRGMGLTHANRLWQRAAALAALVALTAPGPGAVFSGGPALTPAQAALQAALAGAAFAAVLAIYGGIRETARCERGGGSLARELVIAGLIALALSGLSGLHPV